MTTSPALMRKYLDILNEQSVPPVGAYIDPNTPPEVAARVKAMDQAGRGEINKGYYDTQSPEIKASMLRQVNQAPENPNAQTADQREAGTQAMIDQGKMTRAQAGQAGRAGAEYFQDPKQTATTKPTTTKQTTPAQPAAQPAPRPTTTIEPEVQARVPLGGKSDLYGGIAYDYAGGTAPGNPKAQLSYQGDSGGRVSIARSLDPNMPGSTEVRGSYPLSQNLTATGAYKQTDAGAKQAQLGLDYNLGQGSKLSGTYQQNAAGGPADPRFNVTYSKSF